MKTLNETERVHFPPRDRVLLTVTWAPVQRLLRSASAHGELAETRFGSLARLGNAPRVTFELSYTSVVPVGVAMSVITSQSMVLSGGGASVSEITPKKPEMLFFSFSVVSDEPSVWSRTERGDGHGTDTRRHSRDSC